ncbi:MAG: NAD-dependent epimerase/dehydratase family protein [Caldilinea sp.]|nr:NAD-dependent epimerase/dehydratase family protein [Caldilineaceae bacterium]MCB9125865.1 NAD-dependent epimerase/dehydratase family protein [Caldilineaceae bacterium]MCW5845271.1 NAD-dependent epimerase/dehydratase family protein [Caldilinea sp.]
MRLLIIGGTAFVGRHLAEQALARDHAVTLFNRGRTNPGILPQAEHLTGDRNGDLAALRGRSWDAVVDTCGYHPRDVRHMAAALDGAVGHYTFVSTLSVYPDDAPAGVTEASPVAELAGDPEATEVSGESYGPLKVLCERALLDRWSGAALVVRPGLIVGPYDRSDRFTYWPVRIARGGEVLAPGDHDAPVQFVHAGDLAAFMLDLAEQGETGIFNAAGPADRLAMLETLATCREVTGSAARLTWVDDAFLLDQSVGAYVEMPLWVPASYEGFSAVDCRKAIARGLRFRPLAQTVHETLTWHATRPADTTLRAGLSSDREAELLALWHRSRQE